MSKQNKNNSFDDFKSQFEEQSHLDQGWNSPPDFVFEDAIATVNKNTKRKKNKTIFFLSFFILIAALFINQYLSYNKVNTLQEKVDLLSSDLSSEKTTKDIVPTKNIDHKIETVKINDPISSAVTDQHKNSGQHPKSNPSPTSIDKQAPAVELHSAVTPSMQEVHIYSKTITTSEPLKSTSLLVNKKEEIALSEKSRLDNILRISNLISGPLAISQRELRQAIAFTHQLDVETKRKIILGLSFTRNSSSLIMKGGVATNQTLTKYDDYYGGYGLQSFVSVPVTNRLNWRSNLAYDKIHNNSLLIASSSYTKSNEKEMTTGITMYEATMDIESPVGALEHTMAFEVDPLMTREGDSMDEQVTLDQCLSIVSISSGLDYSIFRNSKFNFRSGVSFGGSYVSNLDSSLDLEVSMDNKTMYESTSMMKNAKMLNRYFGFIQLSSAFDFNIGNNINLSAGFGYNRSLTSLRSTADGGPSTYLVNWSSSLGLKKSF